jgi:hypothetical protein
VQEDSLWPKDLLLMGERRSYGGVFVACTSRGPVEDS